MKIMIKLSVIMGLVFLLTGTTQKVMAQNEDVSLQSFYDELSPYGTWIQDPQYGYVWRPDVDQDEFRPYYSNGRWAMTEYGNTWVSNYDWGWAPFHYGRWVYNRYNQWLWIPDTIWGPAWVSWRSGGGYYGWAPLGPSISIGINIGHGGYRVPDFCWNFIPYSNIYYNSYPRYYASRNRVYIQNTVIINNTYVRGSRTYYTGPRAEDIRRTTNQNVTVYNINRSSRPGASRVDNNTVNIYNPRPSRGEVNNANAAPRNVVQGNVNRGVVGRDNNGVVSTRPGRGDNNNTFGDNRNGNISSRPGRGENGNVTTDGRNNGATSTRPSRGNEINSVEGRDRSSGAPTGDNNPAANQRPSVFGRSRENNDNQPQRVDRSQMPQRMERSREMPQQPQAQPQPQQRVERPQPIQQAPQQRMERPQPQMQPQRTERVQQAPPQRSSGSEGRGSRGEGGGGGRPGRGGR